MRRLWDISQRLRPDLPVWPGDTPFRAEATWTHEATPVQVSKVTFSTHSGAHADAPRHYDPAGATAEALDLRRYLGACRVVDARGATGAVRLKDVAAALADPPPRVLLRTFEAFPHDRWVSDFTAVSAELVEALADRGVLLIGSDAPSMDPQASKDLPAHNAIRRRGLSILEGLVLDDVPFGDYELIALPLPLTGLDASPVRAILRELDR
ncbi:MAG: kynB [Phenylobacterium sp.]|nr:kynB [Phenylobacterium sp.]MDB5494923.1 kynB [Phenylobacterium sp.]